MNARLRLNIPVDVDSSAFLDAGLRYITRSNTLKSVDSRSGHLLGRLIIRTSF